MPVPIIAAAVKAVAGKAIAAKAATAIATKAAAAKVAAKVATKTATAGAVKTAAVKAVPKIAAKQKIGLELLGDSKANLYPGKVSPTGSKLKEIAKKVKEKADKVMKNMSESGEGKEAEWSKRGPIVTGPDNPPPSTGAFDEEINKLKRNQ